jgi:hypothetical protein
MRIFSLVSRLGILKSFFLLGIIFYLITLSLVFSLTQITRKTNFNLALSVTPSDPSALANKATAKIASTPQRPDLWRGAKILALRSLRAQAVNPSALRLLAFTTLGETRNSARNKFARLAIKSSRREAAAHLLMIEDLAKYDDVGGVLRHYDLAMRTSLASRTQLSPLLTNAIEDEQVREALVPTVKARPNWLYDFFDYAITSSNNPKNLATLIEESGGWPDDPKYDRLTNKLLSQMITKYQFASFKRHYLTLKNSRPSLLDSPAISINSLSDRFGILAWQKLGSSSAGMDYVEGQLKKGAMHLYAGSGDRQIVTRKILFLSPGSYDITAAFSSADMSNGASLQWSLACITQAGNVVWSIEKMQLQANSAFRQAFRVPVDCEAQALDIGISGGQSQQGAEIVIESITLSRARMDL